MLRVACTKSELINVYTVIRTISFVSEQFVVIALTRSLFVVVSYARLLVANKREPIIGKGSGSATRNIFEMSTGEAKFRWKKRVLT